VLVAIAGGHGRIGLRLTGLLTGRGDEVRGLIRNPAHGDDVRAAGGEPALCDIESPDADVADAIDGCDAVAFAAGAGPGSGVERKWTIDFGGAVKLIDAARQKGVDRYLIVSSMGAADPPAEGGGVFGEYLRAKAEADRTLAASGLAFTIVRPGRLTDDPGTGRVTVGERLESGEVSRDDVAAVLAGALSEPRTIGATFDLVAGETPIEDALAALGGSGP
jgi:nucleoside-diphosphate-sugar epimerase